MRTLETTTRRSRNRSRELGAHRIALFIALCVRPAGFANAQSASADLTQQAPEPALQEEMLPGPSAEAGRRFDASWVCEGFAAAPDPWMTADAELRLLLGSQVLDSRVFSVNYWGGTNSISTTVPAADYIRTLQCQINVSCSGCSSVSAGDSEEIYPELTPYISDGSDSGNWWWNNMWRRDIWYQMWHHNSTPRSQGGQITEEFSVLSNPCNLTIFQGNNAPVNGSGQFLDTYFSDVDLGCEAVADQWYRHSKVGASVIHEQRWRWDATGVWSQ